MPIVDQVSEKRLKREVLSKKAQREKIKTILASSVEENEELVFGIKKNIELAKTKAPKSERDLMVEAMRMGMRRTGRVAGITVEIPRKWKGSPQDLSELNAVSKVSDLTLVGQELDEKVFENLKTFTALNSLTIKDCKFELDDLSDSDWGMAIQEVTISDQKVTSQLIESFRTITSLQSLSLDRCIVEPESLLEIDKLRSLRGLSLTRMELGEDVFKALAKQNRLTYANLARCRFQSKLYQELVAKRPRLQVEFSGQALLGVHGSADLGMGSTNFSGAVGSAITQVVPGSAADKSGMQVGDIISKVDERTIASFDDLRLCIAAHNSGDRLTFRVKRGDRSVDLKVVLAAADGMDD